MPLEVTCKEDATGTVINLTGFTSAKLKYVIGDGALQTKTMTISATPTDGKATYKFLAGELSPGEFRGEVELVDGASFLVTSVNNIKLDIKAKVA